MFDVDIDIAPHTKKDGYGVRAITYDPDSQDIKVHASGMYANTNMPVDGVTGWAAVDYEQAEDLGFIKVDLLVNTTYSHFTSKQDVLDALNKEPDWNLLLDEKVVSTLPQIAKHYDLVSLLEPKSIEDLADILALIRPGKQHLIEPYMKDKQLTRENLYRKSREGHSFKKAHAIAYAMMIVCLLNKRANVGLVEF